MIPVNMPFPYHIPTSRQPVAAARHAMAP